MAFIGWIISTVALLGGLALRQDVPVFADHGVQADLVSRGLFALAFLACPAIWRDRPLGIGRGPRIALGLAMLLAAPLVLMASA